MVISRLSLFSRRLFYTNQTSTTLKHILIYLDERSQLSEALARRIKSELRKVHLKASETDKLIDSPQVPYTVVITKRTLEDGVVELKHFSPCVREEVHVSELTARLLLQTGAVGALRCAKASASSPPSEEPSDGGGGGDDDDNSDNH